MKVWFVVGMLLATATARAQDATPAPPPASASGDLASALITLFDPFATTAQRRLGFESPALRDRRAIPPLVFLLSDLDPDMRAAAAHALAAFDGDPRVEQALIARARARHEDLRVRIAAV